MMRGAFILALLATTAIDPSAAATTPMPLRDSETARWNRMMKSAQPLSMFEHTDPITGQIELYSPLYMAIRLGRPLQDLLEIIEKFSPDLSLAPISGSARSAPIVFLLESYLNKVHNQDPSWQKPYETLLKTLLQKGAKAPDDIPCLTLLSFPRDLALIRVYTQYSATGLLSLLSRDIPEDPALFAQDMQWLPQFYKLLHTMLPATSSSSQKKYLPQIKRKLQTLLANETLDVFAKVQCQQLLKLITPPAATEAPVSSFTKIALSTAQFIENYCKKAGYTLLASGVAILGYAGCQRQRKQKNPFVIPKPLKTLSSAASTPVSTPKTPAQIFYFKGTEEIQYNDLNRRYQKAKNTIDEYLLTDVKDKVDAVERLLQNKHHPNISQAFTAAHAALQLALREEAKTQKEVTVLQTALMKPAHTPLPYCP